MSEPVRLESLDSTGHCSPTVTIFPLERSTSPESYKRIVASHSKRSFAKTLYSGGSYDDLLAWLEGGKLQRTEDSENEKEFHMSVLHDLTPIEKSRTLTFDLGSSGDLQACRRSKTAGQILFLRGMPSADWITTVGGKYAIDPEFFVHHLDFLVTLPSRAAFSFPGPLSSSVNIIRLCAATVLSRGNSAILRGDSALQKQRKCDEELMTNYRRYFRSNTKPGDSIVREFSTIDGRYSVLEQSMTICVTRHGNGWTTLVWLDSGNVLTENDLGPWATHISQSDFASTTLPVIQRHPKMTVRRTISERVGADISSECTSSGAGSRPFVQSINQLPYDFESFLKHSVARSDPLYALSNVFQHAISSHSQILNLLNTRLAAEIGPTTKDSDDDPFENILFLQRFLDRQIGHLTEGLRGIKSIVFDCVTQEEDVSAESEKARNALISDYEELLERARNIRARCAEGMVIIMNRAVIKESRKAIEQTASLKRLTLLASLFVPLSFSTSLFGMNFREFGQGRLTLWIFPVVALPILVFTYLIYFGDMIFTFLAGLQILNKSASIWRISQKEKCEGEDP